MSDNKGSTEGKQAAPGDDTGSKKSDSQSARRNSGSGHEVTGAEKYASLSGSGGVPLRTGQGYEHLAEH
jgi:hypothetical protein